MNNSKYILVVDDTQENLKVVNNFLKEKGYLVAMALDGDSALKALEAKKFDLILLDIMMPVMDGFEVCRRIKANETIKDIPVIFLTARSDTGDVVKGFKVGGIDYITKPFQREELLIRVKSHLELADSKNKIIEMNKTRDKLYSIIAHDIRSPLASIKLALSALADDILVPGSDMYKELISELTKTTKVTLQLLTDLLIWTRSQNESVSLDLRNIDIKSLVDDCIQLLNGNAALKEIQVSNHIEGKAVCYVDEVTMHTVFRNLLSNAIKFTPQKGKIEFLSEEKNGELYFTVKDSGIGMTEEVIQKILKEDKHITTTGTNRETGTGLGLIMIKAFLKQNKGKLDIKSKPGKGTEFIISLPKTRAK